MSLSRAAEVTKPVLAFTRAVPSGEWGAFVEGLAPEATVSFKADPVGPFVGREAIFAAYEAQPPTDTVRFAWDKGGTGTTRLLWEGGLVTEREIAFDAP